MGFLTSLFGGTGNTVVTVLLALGIVLVLIVLGVWALKVLFNVTSNVGRGRNRRLSVIDSTSIDSKRHLVLIRRDNTEHLLVVGGPQDIVVETNITPPPEPTPIKRPKRRISPAPVSPSPVQKSEPDHTVEALSVVTSIPEPESQQKAPDIAPPSPPRRTTSLRHTGLLRSANRVEPALHPQPSASKTGIDDAVEDDSATKSAKPDTPAVIEPVIDKTDDMNGGNDSADKSKTDDKAEASS